MLERIQRGLVILGYENQMDGLFEPSFRRNSEDRSIGGECGAKRCYNVAMPEGKLRYRLCRTSVILQSLMQWLEGYAMKSCSRYAKDNSRRLEMSPSEIGRASLCLATSIIAITAYRPLVLSNIFFLFAPSWRQATARRDDRRSP